MVKILGLSISVLLIAAASFGTAKMDDLTTLTQARVLFEKNKLNDAIALYSKIRPSSDFWLEALEERAWANTRQGEFEKALGDLQSITSAVWAPQVGPETYMLSTFVSLKICAYKDVLKKIETFKKQMLPRVDSLEALLNKPLTAEMWAIVIEVPKQKMTLASMGKDAEKFPRYFFRDQKLIKAAQSGQKEKALVRLQELAKIDLEEITQNLKKMKVIEVEMMQYVLTANANNEKNKKLSFDSTDKNKTMTFPITDDEVWIDEVGHYQVKAQMCPFRKGASL